MSRSTKLIDNIVSLPYPVDEHDEYIAEMEKQRAEGVMMLELAGVPFTRIEKSLEKFKKSHTLQEWQVYVNGMNSEIYISHQYLDQLYNLICNSWWEYRKEPICPSGIEDLENMPATELITYIKNFSQKDTDLTTWADYDWLSYLDVVKGNLHTTDFTETLNTACKWLEDACYQRTAYESQSTFVRQF